MIKTAKLIIGEKEIEVQITDKQISELINFKKVTGFEKAKNVTDNFFVDSCGCVFSPFEDEEDVNEYYKFANCYSDRKLAEWCARNDTLMRKMRRWAAEHNDYPLTWKNSEAKYRINYDFVYNRPEICDTYGDIENGTIYFADENTAEQALIEFGEEIEWLCENRPEWF